MAKRMRLIVAIIQDRDADAVIGALTGSGQRVTRIGTTGGFLQQGLSTLLIGTAADAVRDAITTIQVHSRRRMMFMPLAVGASDPAYALGDQVEIEIGGATMYVLDVEHFEQI
jgi:uncharacterized protein YaaQ